MTLRRRPIHRDATLPDGRVVEVRVGVADDPYLEPDDEHTVSLELWTGGEVLATVDTILSPEDLDDAEVLATAVAEGLAAGRLEPTVAAVEPLADRRLA